jgi:septum formation protein
MEIVLASASPRRQELLKNAGIPLSVRPANLKEIRRPGEDPKAFAERMGREKAEAVHKSIPDACILAADTVVVVDDHVLGKPDSVADAARMLRLLAGRQHKVITGVCLLGTGFEDVRSETTTVQFNPVTDDEIQHYISTGEPMDKAGAYGIQGLASRWISRIEGDYFNVVGLPVALVWGMLHEHGVL